jgi:glutamine synthetase
VDCADTVSALRGFCELVTRLRQTTAVVEQASAHHDSDPMKHASQISRELKPAMAELRATVDTMESLIATDLWPFPTYRDLLFLK